MQAQGVNAKAVGASDPTNPIRKKVEALVSQKLHTDQVQSFNIYMYGIIIVC